MSAYTPKALTGPQGIPGIPGPEGLSAFEVAVADGFVGTVNEWILSLQGADGESAYAAAVAEGFVGTQVEWIASLQGLSAYQVALANGFVGTEAEWLASLVGTGAVTSVMGETGVVAEVDYLQFNTAATTLPVVGGLKWNDTDGTMDIPLKGGNVVLQVGQELVLRARNESGSTLLNGQVAYISGSNGIRTTVEKAKADSNATSMGTIGIATEDIANNAEGFITVAGHVHELNTSAFTDGDELWLSSATAGAITAVRPIAPLHGVRLGWCVRSHATQGIIWVDVNTGAELNEMHDVKILSVAAGHFLRYNAGGYWENIIPIKGDVGLGNVDNTSDATKNSAAVTLANKTIVVANNTITTAASGNLTSTELNAALAELQADIDTKGNEADNLLINSDFRINQRVYTSNAALAAGVYGHDRWKAGASGGQYTFTQLTTSTQITITSGKSLIQVVDGHEVKNTSYVLSWTGTAQGRYAVNSATPAGSYAASPILITGQTVGSTMSVEFNAGTLGTVQLIAGSAAATYKSAPLPLEYFDCMRYYEKSYNPLVAPGTVTNNGCATWASVLSGTGIAYGFAAPFQVTKRATPTVVWYSPQTGASGNAWRTNTSSDVAVAGGVSYNGMKTAVLSKSSGDWTAGDTIAAHYTAECEL